MAIDISAKYKPHPGQQKLHDSPAKEKYVEAGRRFGKSRAGVGEILYNYVEWLEDYSQGKRMIGLIPGWHCWIVVPNFPQGRQTWHELMELIPRQFISRVNHEDNTIYLKGPTKSAWGFIELKSAHDPTALQTVGLDFLWIQEAQDVSDAAANERLRPALTSAGRNGRALFEGIPSMWSDHWFRRGCVTADREFKAAWNAVPRQKPTYQYFHFTAFDNPMLSEDQLEEIEFARNLMTDAAWRRMYMAEFNLNSGFFKNVDSCIAGDVLERPVFGRNYVAGLDFGVSQDATVLNIMDMNSRAVVNRYRWDSTPWPVMREHIISLHEEWNFANICCDTSNMGGIAMYQELVEANLPAEEFKFHKENRDMVLGKLQVAVERASIRFPQIDSMIREMRMFQYVRLSSGSYRVQAPQGENDDEVMALALALHVCNDPVPVTAGHYMTRGRYLPTMTEALGNYQSMGAQMMRDRINKKRLERWERSGVVL